MSDNKLDFNEVRQRANGHWVDIIGYLAKGTALEEAIDRSLSKRHGPCPLCGGNDRFLFDDKRGDGNYVCSPHGNGCGAGDGIKLLSQYFSWTIPVTFERVAECLGFMPTQTPKHVAKNASSGFDPNKLNRIWQGAYPGNDPRATALRRYLVERGLAGYRDISRVIRMHPALDYWMLDDEATEKKGAPVYKSLGKLPALLALVTAADGKAVAMQRIYLDPEGGKANVPEPKKTLGKKGAAYAVRIDTPTDVLCVAEGIETALSVRLATGLPVWAALDTGGLKTIVVPDSVRVVHIFADFDRHNDIKGYRPGTYAAAEAADRLADQGIVVNIHMPPGPIPESAKGVDWADVWFAKQSGDAFAASVLDTLPARLQATSAA